MYPKPFNLFDTFFLVVGSVAIHLVYVNANLFLSLKNDQLRMLSRLSLDFTATGYTLYFMSVGIVSIFNYRQSAKLQKELVDHNEGGCVSA